MRGTHRTAEAELLMQSGPGKGGSPEELGVHPGRTVAGTWRHSVDRTAALKARRG